MARKKSAITPPPRYLQVAKMKDEFVECRAWGHPWKVVLAYGAVDPDTGNVHKNWARMEGTCPRCTMGVTRIYDQFFGLVISVYKRPPGYDIKGGGHVKWRQEARTESFGRKLGGRGRKSKPATA